MAALIELPTSVCLAGRSLGVLLFTAAACGKLANRSAFVAAVRRYDLLPGMLAPAAAAMIIAAELMVAASLLTGWQPAFGALFAAVLLLGFAAAMTVNLTRGKRDMDCGCSLGVRGQRIGWPLVLRNVVLAALVLPAGAVPAAGTGGWMALADGMLAGVALMVLQFAFSQLAAIHDMNAEFQRRFT